jgi:Predicted dehydrogenases and related proteins
MDRKVSVLLSGIGGYGELYVRSIFEHEGEGRCNIAGIVDPNPYNSSFYSEISTRGIPIYSSMESFFEVSEADLTVISSPIQYHCPQTCTALQNASNVLCEKPMCATVPEALRMIKTRDEADRLLAIGYQWSFSKAILDLKMDVMNGNLGKPKRLKTIVLWPRDDIYYKRGWAGKKLDAQGNWILDSVANNATAHYLHNMFFILGDKLDSSAYPEYVTAELYRANKIENYDTCAVRVMTKDGVEILFYASHAVETVRGPVFEYEFENAVVTFENIDENSAIKATFTDGKTKLYGNPSLESPDKKLWTSIDAILGKGMITCGPEAALSHTICINAMSESVPDILTYSDDIIRIKDYPSSKSRIIYVDRLADAMSKSYESSLLPAEIGFPWSGIGKRIYTVDMVTQVSAEKK